MSYRKGTQMVIAEAPTSLIVGAALCAIIGGLGAGLRLVIKITRIIDGQLGAMEANTTAITKLTDTIGPLHEQVENHEERLQIIEPIVLRDERGRFKRRPAYGDAQ